MTITWQQEVIAESDLKKFCKCIWIVLQGLQNSDMNELMQFIYVMCVQISPSEAGGLFDRKT